MVRSISERVYKQVHDSLFIHILLDISILSVPGDIPQMFEALAGQRQVTFSWSPPLLAKDGVTTSYTLSCSPSPSSLPLTTTTLLGSLTVDGFTPYTAYACYMVATIDVTPGPPANISFTTLEDCKTQCNKQIFCQCIYIQIHTFSCV